MSGPGDCAACGKHEPPIWSASKADLRQQSKLVSSAVQETVQSNLLATPLKQEKRIVANDPSYLFRGQGKLGSLTPPGGSRIAVVSTMRDVGDGLMSWIEWYRMIGFAHIFVYLDDPICDREAMQGIRAAFSADFLSIACCSPELKREWVTLKSWHQFKSYIDDRMARQLLNAAHCIRCCHRAPAGSMEAADWLLHLDSDELFLPPSCGLVVYKHNLNIWKGTVAGCATTRTMRLYQRNIQ